LSVDCAVSVQLPALADELKVDLFVRAGRRLVPTPAARALEQHARKVLEEIQRIKDTFDRHAEKDARPFRLDRSSDTSIVTPPGAAGKSGRRR